MSNARTPLIAGNWKMNYDHLQAIAFTQKLAWSLKDAGHEQSKVEVAVFPPFTDLRSVQTLIAADKLQLALGAQDVSANKQGAHTGDIAADMLTQLDVSYVIIGHSERRAAHNETDEIVADKALNAQNHGLTPVICVGETAEDLVEHGAAAVPVAQVKAALAKIKHDKPFVIAYEPVWAIGSGEPATPEQAETVCAAIRAEIAEVAGADIAENTRVLYGGSVTSANIARLMREKNIDGALVGGASLKVEEFSKIVQFPKHVVI